jgi:hypothetical protein
MRTVFLFLFFLGFGLNPLLLAQGQILRMNGREIQAGFLEFKPSTGVIYYQKKAGKGPIKAIPAYSVFSFTDSNGESVLYRQDSTLRNFELTEKEARAFVYGRRSARKNYESVYSYIGGGLFGSASLVLNYFWAPGPALLFMVGQAYMPPKAERVLEHGPGNMFGPYAADTLPPGIQAISPTDTPFVNDPLFQEGYRLQAGKRKLRNALMTAVPAIAAGMVVRYYFIQ